MEEGMAKGISAVYALLFFFLFFSSSCVALYEDQVGLMDWHQKYIGKVRSAIFQSPKSGRRRVVVSTEENVVASLDLRKGDIFWRHVLGDSDVLDTIDIALGKYVITLSSKGSILRAWSLADGQMVWETSLKGSIVSKSLLSLQAESQFNKNTIFVFGGGWLHAVSSVDGEALWQTQLSTESLDVLQISQSSDGKAIYAVGLSDSSQLVLYQIDGKTGEVEKHTVKDFPGGFYGEIFFVSDSTLVCLDAARSAVLSASLLDGELSSQVTPISDLVQEHAADWTILPSKHDGLFAIRSSAYTVLVKLTDDGKLETYETISNPACISDSIALSNGEQAFGVVEQKGNKVSLRVILSTGEKKEFLEDTVEIDSQRGSVENVYINNYVRTDRSHGFRALITLEDHSLLLLQQGKTVWSREDGLASIVDAMTSELPVEKNGVSVAKVEQTLLEWLEGHLLKLKGTLMLATPDEVAEIQALRLKSSEKSKMTRDHNGFRKLVVVLTKAGKIMALHSGDGRVIWSLLLPSLRKSEACQNPLPFKLYQWQDPHHHALDTNPSILVVGRCGLNADAPSTLSFVDSYTGRELRSQRLTYSIEQVIPLALTDSMEQRLHLLIDSDKQAHLFPRSADSLNVFQKELPNTYVYFFDSERQVITGRALGGSCLSDVSDEYCFGTREVWSIVMPSESEKIAKTASRNFHEAVHTQAKILGDQDVMYKYISKNVLFVATVSPISHGKPGLATPEEASLVVYLIDTITGRILHRVTHLGSQGPVNAVFSENWVVYHYFSLRAHRYEMTVIEMYDQSHMESKDVMKLVLGQHNLTVPVSSFSRPEVSVKTQSYFFPHSVRTMAVTSTAKGITSRQLLIGTATDQVLALDKRFLDPRRTANPTQAEKDEGIIPLTDSLPIIPQSYLTHSLQVEGLRGIVTVPARLESTCLVFSYGVDLFFTRIAPSKIYDSLTEEFSYALLLITIFALVVAILVTWVLSEKKELREKWR